MSSRNRPRGSIGTPRQSNNTPRQPSRPTALPPYEPLAHNLNPTAQHALHNLPTTHSMTGLKERLQRAANHLAEVTGDLNDQHTSRKAEFEKSNARRAAKAREFESSQNTQDDEEAEQRFEDAENSVKDLTKRLDEGTRKVIDIQALVEGSETALKELDANISQGRTATQSTLGASQYRQRSNRRQAHNGDDSEDDGDNTDQAESTLTGLPALSVFQCKIAASTSTYESLPPAARYVNHNDYISFRKMLHDAQHPDDNIPLPHSSTWFSDPSTQVGPQQSQRTRSGTADSSDSDSELQTLAEKRSIRCPLTLLPMTDPLTSTKCPHSFQASAILGMLDASTLRVDGSTQPATRSGGAEKALKCPECLVLLTASCLKPDPVLLRKIKRIEAQERRRRDGGSEEEDDGGVVGTGRRERGPEFLTSSPVRGKARELELQRVKKERTSQMNRGRLQEREVSVVLDSQAQGGGMVVDDDDEDEEDEEDDDDDDDGEEEDEEGEDSHPCTPSHA